MYIHKIFLLYLHSSLLTLNIYFALLRDSSKLGKLRILIDLTESKIWSLEPQRKKKKSIKRKRCVKEKYFKMKLTLSRRVIPV